jgi:DNA helicase IV
MRGGRYRRPIECYDPGFRRWGTPFGRTGGLHTMTQNHPELAEEQAYIDHAYACLDSTRESAWRLRELNEADLGGTFQARFERNAFDEALVKRLGDLDLGDAALVFGRIDRYAEGPDATETFHIGRLAVADEEREPVVVDWRAPVAEPFYRATGRDPMGLARRRHFSVEGARLLGIEDELFGEGHLGVGQDDGLGSDEPALRGYSTLLASIERGRTGTLGDIVATIQAEQDEIIRSPQTGVLVVQGGPGTGKTVVALHRAAYLLYTHRFPLEDQGVLVIGPNRVFLRYIEQVLPSLGEAGVDQGVLADLVPGVRWARDEARRESLETSRLKGDERMSEVIDRAIRDRQRPLRDDLVVPFRTGYLRLSVDESARIVKAARRRYRRHNLGRRFVENEVWAALAAAWRDGDTSAGEIRSAIRTVPAVREALDRMWPLLTPAQLLHDLFGSKALLRLAVGSLFPETDAVAALHRARSESVDVVRWTDADVALLDDAREVLGPKPGRGGKVDPADEIRTYGHIVIDEVQDLTPMQLKMATRRSLNGSMTVVGDIAQATGPHAPDSWDEVVRHLPDRKRPRVIGLSVGYRIPEQIMALANRVMHAATPGLRAPRAVRVGEAPPELVPVAAGEALSAAAVAASEMLDQVGGNVAVVVADSQLDAMSNTLTTAGVAHTCATRGGLDDAVTVVPVSVAKGLELDGVVVVEPADIVDDSAAGLRALYVALTRSTQRLTVIHAKPLPEPLAPQPSAA